MGDLRIGQLGALRQHGAAQNRYGGKRGAESNEHVEYSSEARRNRRPGIVGSQELDGARQQRFLKIYAEKPSRLSTALVKRSQRLPANGNASMTTGPILFSTFSRNMARARCSRVFTVSGFSPRISAVSSTFIPSMPRVMKTGRKGSGISSIARSTTCWISR